MASLSPPPISLHAIARFGLLCLSLLLFASCFDTCEPPFPPRNIIDKFRILAIKADPPEVAPGQSTKLSFLATKPDGDIVTGTFPSFPQCVSDGGSDRPSAFWVMCLPALGAYKGSDAFCTNFSQTSDGGPADAGGGDGGNPLGQIKVCSDKVEGDGKKAEFCVPLPPCGESVTWTAPSNYLNPLPEKDRLVGAEVILALTTALEGTSQLSLKRIRVSTRPAAEQNRNPRILEMSIAGKKAVSCVPGDDKSCETITIPSNRKAEVQLTLDPERFDWIPATETRAKRREDIQIIWFASAGEIDTQTTIRSGQTPPNHSPWPSWYPNDYKGAPLKQGLVFRFIAVASDRRGGFDWRSIRVQLGPPDNSENTPD